MRKTRNQQLPLAELTTEHPKAKEFAQISAILDSNNSIYQLAGQDLDISNGNVGANGMTAEQVIRATLIKQIGGYTLPSGSSSSASAAMAYKLGLCDSDKNIHMQGGIIDISISQEFDITMTGKVTKVAVGEISDEIFDS